MNAPTFPLAVGPEGPDVTEVPSDNSFIPVSDPDITLAEIEAVDAVLRSPRLSGGAVVEAFGIGPGHEVIASPYSFRETTHAISLAGARPRFVDIDYWTGTLTPEKVEVNITANTRAIVACNNNGHPAQWEGLRALARKHDLILIEDSTEAIGSRYQGALV